MEKGFFIYIYLFNLNILCVMKYTHDVCQCKRLNMKKSEFVITLMKYKTVRTDKLTAVVNTTTFIVMLTF